MKSNVLKTIHLEKEPTYNRDLNTIVDYSITFNPARTLPEELKKEVFSLLSHIITQRHAYINPDTRRMHFQLFQLLTFAFQLQYPPLSETAIHHNGSARIAYRFLNELEAMFPLTSPNQELKLRLPIDFADKLCVHVNHLNRSVKEITGKTTSQHITERIIREAKNLLRYTNWSISEISYSLGFSEVSHFTNFFKKKTNCSPRSFRSYKDW